MQRSVLLTLTSIFMLLGLASCAAPETGTAEDVRSVRTAWNDAYNAGDIDRLIALYTEDAVSMAPGVPATIGRAAIKNDIGGFLAGNKVQETAEIQDIMIEGDLAVERANYVTQITPRAGAHFTERGKHIVAYRREPDGQWRIRWEIWNGNEAAAK